MTKRTWEIIGVLILLFAIGWISQFFYFDNLTKKLSVEGVGPIFLGHLSTNLEAAVARPFMVHAGEKDLTIKPEQLQTWIEPYHRAITGGTEYRLIPGVIETDLRDFAPAIAIKPKDARFGMVNGILAETEVSQAGQELDLRASQQAIAQALIHNLSEASLVVSPKEAEYSLKKLKSLGIDTLVGEGTSNFAGSPNHRIHNIKVGAQKFDNIIIAPGASFSFVNNLGDVDATTGYLPELVIKGDKVIPEYGGGLCQVSTTLFRAAIYAGFVIDERRPHSFPVHYYNPQGFDSTIYPGSADLKFTNNTPFSILIQSRVEGNKITFDMFGASDGRKVALDGPHQYDVQPDGSMKAVFTRTITFADGTEKKDVFRSTYKSPSLFEVIKNPLD